MESDDGVKKLVELIFSKQFNTAEMTGRNVSLSTCLLTNDFTRRLQSVLCMKHMIFNKEWQRNIDGCSHIMQSSTELYLNCVMFACLTEYKCYQNVFESFISVLALLELFNVEILTKTGIDFCDLNTDVFMVLYKNVMKRTFYEQGGLQQLVEYIHGHRYLTWKWNSNDIVSTDEPTLNMIQEDIKKKSEKEYKLHDFAKFENDSVELDATSIILTKQVLSTTSVELPSLPNNPDRIKCLEASRNKDIVEINEKRIIEAAAVFVDLDITSQECPSSNSDLKTIHTLNHNSDNAQYENVIQAVIRHNRSRCSGDKNSDNHIQKEADGILENFMDKIKSLTEVLDDYDKH